MADHRPDLLDDLQALGREVPAAAPEGVVDAVLARIAGEPVPRAGLLVWLRRRWVALLAGVCGVLVVLVLTPAVRASVAEWFGLGGVVVRDDARPRPSSAPPPPVATGDLTLSGARRLVDFTPVLPRALGEPGGVEVSADRRVLSMTWTPQPGQVLRLDQFDGALAPHFLKSVNRDDVEWLPLGGGISLWIPGPHEVVVLGPGGQEHTAPPRLAGNTLIWQHADITLRLEGAIDRERAVAIALSAG